LCFAKVTSHLDAGPKGQGFKQLIGFDTIYPFFFSIRHIVLQNLKNILKKCKNVEERKLVLQLPRALMA
jgi:hypothetical protein